MYLDIFGLTDAEGAIGGLVFDGGVPPAVEVEYVVGAGEVEADAACFEGENEDFGAVRIELEAVYHFFSFGLGGTAVEEHGVCAQTVF